MEKFIILVSESGSSEESNLWLACPICNSHNAGKIEAIAPVTDDSDFDALEVRSYWYKRIGFFRKIKAKLLLISNQTAIAYPLK
ncbi:MAG: hypothetical protein ACK5RE_09450 [Pseudanabaena sp.]|jgi:hypothetical protein